MAYTNNDKMLQAVLDNAQLMKYGNYTLEDVSDIYAALASDNVVINTVAQIILRASEGATESELWKQVNTYLKQNI